MRIRLLVLCVVLLGTVLGAAGCSSSGTPASGTSPVVPGASSGGAGASSSGSGGSSGSSGSSGSKAPAGKPGGTVTVRSGGKVVCVITLDQNGTGTCKVSTANYPAGKVTYTGTYSGNGKFKPGTGSTTLTVRPAKQAA